MLYGGGRAAGVSAVAEPECVVPVAAYDAAFRDAADDSAAGAGLGVFRGEEPRPGGLAVVRGGVQ